MANTENQEPAITLDTTLRELLLRAVAKRSPRVGLTIHIDGKDIDVVAFFDDLAGYREILAAYEDYKTSPEANTSTIIVPHRRKS